jgi:hypothetical protein
MLSAGRLADLDLLDHLELFNSAVKVAELLGMSQSSCSRRYRCLSDDLEPDFDRVDGAYRAAPLSPRHALRRAVAGPGP